MALRITIPMPARLTHYVLSSATNGNYSALYWLNDYSGRLQYGARSSADCGYIVALHIGAHRTGPADAVYPQVKHSRIGAARIAAALEIMLTCGNKAHAERAGRVLAGTFDVPDADVVLQFAAFGEVIYG